MKKSQLKELIKQSMTELNSPEYLDLMKKADDTGRGYAERDAFRNQAYDLKIGAMTPDEEKMVFDYEEEEANKHALDSENPLEENTSDIPDDIKWEWNGEVYDRLDYYSGEVGLEGHSPSTGRNFVASAQADYDGDSWDWSNEIVDFIEEVPVEKAPEIPMFKGTRDALDDLTNLRERKEPLSGLIKKADRIVEAWSKKK